eukprot:506920-Prorocentrum_minimum.AAC.1
MIGPPCATDATQTAAEIRPNTVESALRVGDFALRVGEFALRVLAASRPPPSYPLAVEGAGVLKAPGGGTEVALRELARVKGENEKRGGEVRELTRQLEETRASAL